MTNGSPSRRWNVPADRWGIALAAATAVFHLLTARGYGYFRDELYYLACAQHLDWGYVDHPPLIAVLTWLVRATLGASLPALRFLPAMAAAGTVYLTTLMARELGGGRLARILAGLGAALAPIYLSVFSILSMNAFDVFLWAVAGWLVIRILRTGDERLWLLFGAVAGLGLQNKLSMLFLGLGVFAGLLLAREWGHLGSRWLWGGGALSFALFMPHLLWQMSHGWPTLEFMESARRLKNVAFDTGTFLKLQVILLNPVMLPLWLSGLAFYLFAAGGRRYRALGWAYLILLLVFATLGGKPYYLAPYYTILLAAGALVFEPATERRGFRWLRIGAPASVILSGLLLAPLAKPLLPTDTLVRYSAALGIEPGTDERKELGRLSQFFADMHGWSELVDAVADVYQRLAPEDRLRTTIFAQNYGEAGAIDFFGPSRGLPKAISGHNSYYLWGPGSATGELVLILGGNREDLQSMFRAVELGARFHCTDCMPYESDLPIWIARDLIPDLHSLWPQLKNFN